MRSNITFRSNSVKHKFNSFSQRYKKSILNLEIKDINYHLSYLKSEIAYISDRLRSHLPEKTLTDFFDVNEHKLTNFNLKQKNLSINKFNRTFTRYNTCSSFFNNDRTKWLVNISKKSIPANVSRFLSLGDRFGLPINNSDAKDRLRTTLDIVKNFETNCYKLPENMVSGVRNSVAESLKVFLSKSRHLDYIDRHILNEFKNCKAFLKNNDDIFVTRADKGQITVVMDKIEYIGRMSDVLNDESTYKKLIKDPIKQLTHKLNQLVKSWLDNDIIDKPTYYRLKCTNGNLPRCYGLPKVHKAGFPLRVIVSAVGNPMYNIASFLNSILHKYTHRSKSYIKDSWTFVKMIKESSISNDQIMISLDVASLFTNIPKELVLEAIEKRWHEISPNTKFTLPQFLHAINLVLGSTSFCFNGNFYEQPFGSPMGSPLSPIIADLVMDDLETHCLSSFDFVISIFCRYVDDIFAIIPRAKLNDVLRAFNNYHPRLKFTHETEINNSIPFLDTVVIREGCHLFTDWYRKPTFSSRYINFFSNHPIQYKINTITSLIDRAILLSDNRFHAANINIVKEILLNNSFPIEIIDKRINARLKTLKNTVERVDATRNEFDARHCITVPYVKGVSEDIRRIFDTVHLDTIYTIPKKLEGIIKSGKDKLDKDNETELVYKMDCSDCDAIYIGQTKRHLITRVKEHQKDIKKHDSNHSVVSKHRVSCGHNFKWAETDIIHKEKNTKKREIADKMFLIKKHSNTINLKKDTENLNPIYDKVISSL
ncbi:uncharacterized protein [Temnothorax nylanderi]|uniref:uncharacterized protein n=1 Tax=Temnothorax nylanderi TaxID=102681 RepID=UPI003A869991